MRNEYGSFIHWNRRDMTYDFKLDKRLTLKQASTDTLWRQVSPDAPVVVCGWVTTVRILSEKLSFIHITDGSLGGGKSFQIVCACDKYKAQTDRGIKELTTGASVYVEGFIVWKEGRDPEIKAAVVVPFGLSDQTSYPLAKKGHSLEHVRAHRDLSFRTKYYSSVARIRHTLIKATHDFFTGLGYVNVHTPIITASDCEGAGEMFSVTTDRDSFFGKKVGLTVSGQLCAELAMSGLTKIYTFGPTFRAENSNTSRHLAEFWMVEPEVAFANVEMVMQLAEAYVMTSAMKALQFCSDDIAFIGAFHDRDSRLEMLFTIGSHPFSRVTYTDSIDILFKHAKEHSPFDNNDIVWGMDLGSEHEKFLAEHFGGPVFIYNYPKALKSFYMYANPDCKPGFETVAAFDLIVPGIGELIGGSQREDRHDILKERIVECGLDPEEYQGYLNIRKHGTVPHGGFGLGFERLVMLIAGIPNIRDAIPFPRYPKHCEY